MPNQTIPCQTKPCPPSCFWPKQLFIGSQSTFQNPLRWKQGWQSWILAGELLYIHLIWWERWLWWWLQWLWWWLRWLGRGRGRPQASNHNPALLPFSRPCSRYNFIAFYFTLDPLLQNATYFSHYTAAKKFFIVLGLQNAIKCYKAFATTTLYFIWCSFYKMLHSWCSRWHCSVFIFWFGFCI